jgi:serine/threonine protein kinase
MNEGVAKKRASELFGKQISKWTVGKYLGSGKTAFVCIAYRDHQKYAIKIFEKEFLDDKDIEELKIRLDRQLELIGKFHENLIKIFAGGYCSESKCYYLIMEFLDAPPLSKLIKDLPRERIGPLISQIALAARFMEEQNLVHRDIKPENIAICPDFSKAMLLDLGVIRPLEKDEITDTTNSTRFVGTLRYSSPEFLLRQEEHTVEGWRALTFYQLGAVLHDMIMRYPIFEGHTQPYSKLVHAIDHETPAIYAEDVDPDIIHLAKLCLLKRVELRQRFISWDNFNFPKTHSDKLTKAKTRIKNRKAIFQEYSDSDTICQEENKRLFDQLIYDLRSILENSIRTICVGNQDFPRLSISNDLITKEFSLVLEASFTPSKSHALNRAFKIILTASLLDIQAKLVQLQCVGLLSNSSSCSDYQLNLSVFYEGFLDNDNIYVKVDEMIHLMLDQAQLKCDSSATITGHNDPDEQWIVYKFVEENDKNK